MNSAPLEEKLKAFNFNVLTINGHDYDQIESAIKAFHAENDKPTCIILDTVKGHGCALAEQTFPCHHMKFTQEQIAPSIAQAEAALEAARNA